MCNQARSVALLGVNSRMLQLALVHFLVASAIYGQQTIALFWLERRGSSHT